MELGERLIRDEYPDKVDAVRKFLKTFAGDVREGEDFDRDAMLFRLANGGLITISVEFFSDFDVKTISRLLGEWDVRAKVDALPSTRRLVLTTSGTFVEDLISSR